MSAEELAAMRGGGPWMPWRLMEPESVARRFGVMVVWQGREEVLADLEAEGHDREDFDLDPGVGEWCTVRCVGGSLLGGPHRTADAALDEYQDEEDGEGSETPREWRDKYCAAILDEPGEGIGSRWLVGAGR